VSEIHRRNRYFCLFFYSGRLTSIKPRREAQLRRINMLGQIALIARPLEKRTGIGLASWRNVLVSCNIGQPIALQQGRRQFCQHHILHRRERFEVAAFEFDADRKVITALAAMEG